MSDSVPIAMFGFIPVVIALFWRLPPWRAALVGLLLAWMFLPIASYRIQGWPDYTKMSATCGVVGVAIAIFDLPRVMSFRPALIDVPLLVFCSCPFVSSVVNGLGVHEGFSAMFAQAISWGVPYAIGRLYFNDARRLRELAIGVFVGGLLYVPLCFFELSQGPTLHKLVYGYVQPDLDIQTRFGILRPMVFMESGLMLATWMAAASILGLWLWKSAALPLWGRLPLGWLTPLPVVATILMRSVNGWLELALGLVLLAATLASRRKWWMAAVLVLISGYLAVRATGLWSGAQVVPIVALIHPSKGQSMLFRVSSEEIMVAKLRGHAVFGYGRQPVGIRNDHGWYVTLDSMWIATLACFGALGLVSWVASLLVPVAVFIHRVPARRWFDAGTGPAAGLAVIVVLSTVDHLANAMINPIFMVIAGGLASVPPTLGSAQTTCTG